MGPNVEIIRAATTRIVRGKIPGQVRKELSNAVKTGELGHLRKDGLKPEIYFHPDHLQSARDLQTKEALSSICNIKKVLC